MRSALAAGDKKFLGVFHELRNVAAPRCRCRWQHVAGRGLRHEAACRGDRRLYRIKFDLADQILGNRMAIAGPPRFCVWLMSRSAAATKPRR